MAQFSFQSKLDRADHHLQILEKNLLTWTSSKPYSILEEVDSETGDDIVRIKFNYLPYNLRACLDHLAHALALKNRGGLSDEESIQTAFPIYKTKAGFDTRGKGRIALIANSAQTVIDTLQPYHAGDAAVSHWLWLLEKLENIDKHRALLIVPMDSRMIAVNNPSRGAMQLLKFTAVVGATENYTEIARYRFVSPEYGTRVKMNLEVSPNISFRNPPAEGRDALLTLQGIRNFIVIEVIPRLRLCL